MSVLPGAEPDGPYGAARQDGCPARVSWWCADDRREPAGRRQGGSENGPGIDYLAVFQALLASAALLSAGPGVRGLQRGASIAVQARRALTEGEVRAREVCRPDFELAILG